MTFLFLFFDVQNVSFLPEWPCLSLHQYSQIYSFLTILPVDTTPTEDFCTVTVVDSQVIPCFGPGNSRVKKILHSL